MDGDNRRTRFRMQVREAIQSQRYRFRTEKSDWYWIRHLIRFHEFRHSADMGKARFVSFLTGWRSSAMLPPAQP